MLAANIAAGAQGIEDALRYSEQFYVGSARTMAMGNAFTALGGDLGAMGINPASTALYNCCEFSVTGGFNWNKTGSTFYGTEDNFSQKASSTRFHIPNISAVFSLPTGRDYGLVSWTVGFGYAKTSNFNSRISFAGDDANSSLLGNIALGLSGFDNANLLATNVFAADDLRCTPQEVLAWNAYLVNPYEDYVDLYQGATENSLPGGPGVDNFLYKNYELNTSGGIHDMQFNFGMNFNDRLFLGVNANIKAIDYSQHLCYKEQAYQGDKYDSGFNSMEYNSWLNTSGAGVNLQLGAIWVPLDFVRFGISYTTPTLYSLTDTWDEAMGSDFDGTVPDYKSSTVWLSDLYADEQGTDSRDFTYEYTLRAPGRLSIGTAFVFGQAGLISFDWETSNYGKMKLGDNYDPYAFDGVNRDIADYCLRGNIFRVGAEVNVLNNVALRGGYTGYFYGAEAAKGYQYLSFGIGKRITENSSIDVAFRTSLADNFQMKPYDDYDYNAAGTAQCIAPVADITSRFRDLLLTYRVKF